jgi:transcriptional regulator with XRE-family HTH domain
MSERKKKDDWIQKTGQMLRDKRMALGKEFKSREFFVEDRSEKLFNYDDWISSRYLASIELGNNQLSIEKLIKLAYALEIDPVELFSEIVRIYQEKQDDV